MSSEQNWNKIKSVVSGIPMPDEADTIFLFGGGLIGSLSAAILYIVLQGAFK